MANHNYGTVLASMMFTVLSVSQRSGKDKEQAVDVVPLVGAKHFLILPVLPKEREQRIVNALIMHF